VVYNYRGYSDINFIQKNMKRKASAIETLKQENWTNGKGNRGNNLKKKLAYQSKLFLQSKQDISNGEETLAKETEAAVWFCWRI
jgi:hypothetical protein